MREKYEIEQKQTGQDGRKQQPMASGHLCSCMIDASGQGTLLKTTVFRLQLLQ